MGAQINCIQLSFYLFFLAMPHGILFPIPGIEPVPLHWERGVLTPGPPGKSHSLLVNLKV